MHRKSTLPHAPVDTVKQKRTDVGSGALNYSHLCDVFCTHIYMLLTATLILCLQTGEEKKPVFTGHWPWTVQGWLWFRNPCLHDIKHKNLLSVLSGGTAKSVPGSLSLITYVALASHVWQAMIGQRPTWSRGKNSGLYNHLIWNSDHLKRLKYCVVWSRLWKTISSKRGKGVFWKEAEQFKLTISWSFCLFLCFLLQEESNHHSLQ